MAIAHRASSAVVSQTAANPSVAMPSGTVQNDIMVLVAYFKSNVVSTMPAGWTLKTSVNNGTINRLEIWWKRAASGEAGPYTLTNSGTLAKKAFISSFSGCVTSGDPFDTFGAAQANSSSLSITAAAISPSVADCMILFCCGYGDDWTAISDVVANTNPVFTNGAALADATGTDSSIAIAYGVKSSSGTTGIRQRNASGTAALNCASMLALTPGAAPTYSQMSGTGTVDVTGTGAMRSVSRMSATGSVSVAGTGTMRSISRMSATGSVTVTGTGSMAAPRSEMSGTGSVSVTGTGTMRSISRMAGTGGVTVAGTGVMRTISRMSAAGTVTVAGLGAMRSRSHMTATGQVVVTGTGSMGGTDTHSQMSGTGSVSVLGAGVMTTWGRMTGAGSISVVGTGTMQNRTRMAGTGTVSVVGTGSMGGGGATVRGAVSGSVAIYGGVSGSVSSVGGSSGSERAAGGSLGSVSTTGASSGLVAALGSVQGSSE